MEQAEETHHQQSGRDEERDADRRLDADEHSPRSAAAPAFCRRVTVRFQRVARIDSRQPERWYGADESPVAIVISSEKSRTRAIERQRAQQRQRRRSGRGDHAVSASATMDPIAAASEREQQAFGQCFNNQRSLPCTERGANRGIAAASGVPGEQQVREVDAHNQQDRDGGREQDEQWSRARLARPAPAAAPPGPVSFRRHPSVSKCPVRARRARHGRSRGADPAHARDDAVIEIARRMQRIREDAAGRNTSIAGGSRTRSPSCCGQERVPRRAARRRW